jgi:hypothetical protein
VAENGLEFGNGTGFGADLSGGGGSLTCGADFERGPRGSGSFWGGAGGFGGDRW